MEPLELQELHWRRLLRRSTIQGLSYSFPLPSTLQIFLDRVRIVTAHFRSSFTNDECSLWWSSGRSSHSVSWPSRPKLSPCKLEGRSPSARIPLRSAKHPQCGPPVP